jgi:hypothetical protein
MLDRPQKITFAEMRGADVRPDFNGARRRQQ